MFTVVSIMNVLFILVIVYQEHVIRKQSKVIEPLKEKIKELKELLAAGLLNETERSWNLYFDISKRAAQMELQEMLKPTEKDVSEFHGVPVKLSERTTVKPKKTINKKKENV